jgi:hypothetical protein
MSSPRVPTSKFDGGLRAGTLSVVEVGWDPSSIRSVRRSWIRACLFIEFSSVGDGCFNDGEGAGVIEVGSLSLVEHRPRLYREVLVCLFDEEAVDTAQD